mmetsp:Transcript_42439/g.127213  ORF Transcript_42439/g.127213 Transcript_42439/m.127213 type:complete len:252 (-) Transcript_42439:446-1201(-)
MDPLRPLTPSRNSMSRSGAAALQPAPRRSASSRRAWRSASAIASAAGRPLRCVTMPPCVPVTSIGRPTLVWHGSVAARTSNCPCSTAPTARSRTKILSSRNAAPHAGTPASGKPQAPWAPTAPSTGEPRGSTAASRCASASASTKCGGQKSSAAVDGGGAVAAAASAKSPTRPGAPTAESPARPCTPDPTMRGHAPSPSAGRSLLLVTKGCTSVPGRCAAHSDTRGPSYPSITGPSPTVCSTQPITVGLTP